MDLGHSLTTFGRKYGVVVIHDHKDGTFTLQRGPRQVIITEESAGQLRLRCSGPEGDRDLIVDLQEAIQRLYHDPGVVTG